MTLPQRGSQGGISRRALNSNFLYYQLTKKRQPIRTAVFGEMKFYPATTGGQGYLRIRENSRHRQMEAKPVTIHRLLRR